MKFNCVSLLTTACFLRKDKLYNLNHDLFIRDRHFKNRTQSSVSDDDQYCLEGQTFLVQGV